MVYIILVNYNGFDDTFVFIDSIKKKEKKINYKIIVVDNNSTDDSVKKLKKIKDIKLIISKKNLGFAGGNNLGIKYALKEDAKYILLLNNDTIITENLISNMIMEYERHDDLGILGCRIMYYDNKNLINFNGGKINYNKGTVEIYNKKKKYFGNEAKFKYTDYLTGCCMLMNKKFIDSVGLLPEKYFMYYEDVDYCVKTKRKNYKMGILTDSVLYHKESSSSGGEQSPFSIKWNTRNRLLFIKKYCNKLIAYPFFYLTRLMVIMNYKIRGRNDLIKALMEGIRDGKKENRKN